jgi:hypothetical protein
VDVEMQKPLDLQVTLSLACSYEQWAAIIAAASNDKSPITVEQRSGMSLNHTVPFDEERKLQTLTAAEMTKRRKKRIVL